MADREPPREHISVQEAARRLNRSEQNIRDRIKSGTLDGTQDLDPRSERLRYWALESAVAAEIEARADEPARVSDVRDELHTVSAAAVTQLMSALVEELGRQNAQIIPRLEMIVEEIHSQRVEVTEEQRESRRAVLSLVQTLGRMEQRQLEVIKAIEYFKELDEREATRQERATDLLERMLELQERAQQRPMGFWARLFGV